MHIGEVAKLTARTVDAIYFYERKELLPKVLRTEGQFRVYSSADVARLGFIQRMQGLGFSLREIKQLLELRENRQQDCSQVRGLLKAKFEDVRSKLRELERLERELAADLHKCNRELRYRQKHASRSCPVLTDSASAARKGIAC
jgi:MerR family transcriptional regulator, mercuric resistance operon regulatory protein